MNLKYFITLYLCLGLNLYCKALSDNKESIVTWSLQDLLRFAIENSPVITKAKQEKQQANLSEDKARSFFWPRLKLQTIHGLRDQDPLPYNPLQTSTTTLNFSENLWNNTIDWKKLALAKVLKQKAELQYFQKRDQTCLNVSQEYYRYSLLVKSLEIQKNQQKLLRKQFELVSDEYLHGERSRRDFLRFKSQAQRADLDLQNQFTQVEQSRITLMALAGFTDFSEKQQFSPENSPPPLLDLFKKPAELNNTYEDQLLNLTSQSLDLTKEVSLKQLGPEFTVDFKASLGSGNYWNTGKSFASQETQTWGAFLTFNWVLWDGGEIKSNKAIAIIQAESQKTDLHQSKIQLQSEIQKLQKQFLQLKENFKTSEELLILEQNNFLFLEGEYRQSKTTYLDFINGINNLGDAQNRHWRNLFELKQGIILYHYYKGSLFRFLLNDYNQDDEAPEDPIQ